MNVLAQLRAAVASPAPAAPQPAAPCPFTFGDWQPRTDPHAHPGEAQRPIFLDHQLIGWWRRQWVNPQPLHGERLEDLGGPFPVHAVASPDGSALLLAAFDQQAMLERLAQRHGIA